MEKLRLALLATAVVLLAALVATQVVTLTALRDVGSKLTQTTPASDLFKSLGLDNPTSAH